MGAFEERPGRGRFHGHKVGVLMHPLTPLILGQFLISPGLWIGLAVTAAFLAVAVRLRRHRGQSDTSLRV